MCRLPNWGHGYKRCTKYALWRQNLDSWLSILISIPPDVDNLEGFGAKAN